jgi:signal transduction histidine kinase
VEVCYLEEGPLADEGLFLQEERNLLDSIAERLGRVAERFRAEEAVRQRVRELSSLHTIAQTVATSRDLCDALEKVAQMANDLFDARGTYFSVPESEGGDLHTLAGFERDSGTSIRMSGVLPLNRMPNVRRVLEQGEVIILPDAQALPLAEPVRASVKDLGLHAFLLVPLTTRGAVVGLMTVGSDQPGRTFTPEQVALAETIAGDAATMLENARLAEQARITAVDSERHRMARELHDSVTQTLYSIMLQTDATRLALSAGKIDVLEPRLKRLYEHTREAMAEMRLLIFELRPSILEEAGLVAALEARLEAVEVRSGLKVDLQVVGERRLLPEVEIELFRVAVEGLNNVLKHARARLVLLAVTFDEDTVRLTIQDDGIGFDLDAATRYGGYGLGIMAERVQQIGGELRIETAPGAGTALHVEVEA